MLSKFPVPNRNIGLAYMLSIANASAFVSGNWFFFWLRVMTYGQLGVVDALAFAYGLFMEVPTGAIGDLIGKRRTLIISMALNALGFMIMGASESLEMLLFGFLFSQTAWAFFSGALEALIYDSLKEKGQEAQFERVIAADHGIALVTVVISSFLGALMYGLDVRLPHYAWGVMFALGLIPALLIREPAIDTDKFSLKTYGTQLVAGFRQLALPALRPYSSLIVVLLGGYYLYSFGLIAPAISAGLGFDAAATTAISGVLNAFAALALLFVPLLRRRLHDMGGLLLIGALLTTGYLGAGVLLGGGWPAPLVMALGIGAIMLIRLGGAWAQPLASVVINREIASKYRATTLSTVALLAKIPYVATAMIAGAMVEAGNFWLFNVVVGGVLTLIVLFSGVSFALSRRAPVTDAALAECADPTPGR